jgi:uncharacterized membrane protein
MNSYKYLFIGLLLLGSCKKQEQAPTVTCSAVDLSLQTPGPAFLQVKRILATHCLQCHSGVNPQAGLDWSRDCDILTYWDRIKARAVDGDPSPMPQAGLMPKDERNQIMAWINKGHLYKN